MVRLKIRVAWILKTPEDVLQAIKTDLDQHEKIPGLRRKQVSRHAKALLGHPVDALQKLLLLRVSKASDVQEVPAGDGLDLRFQRGRIGILGVRTRSQKAGDHAAVDRIGRVGLRDAQHDDFAARRGEVIPDALFAHAASVRDHQLAVRVVLAIAEAVATQPPGIQAAGHHRPRRYGDGRVATLEAHVAARFRQPAQVGQLVPPTLEDERGLRTIQPDNQDLFLHAAFRRPLTPIHPSILPPTQFGRELLQQARNLHLPLDATFSLAPFSVQVDAGESQRIGPRARPVHVLKELPALLVSAALQAHVTILDQPAVDMHRAPEGVEAVVGEDDQGRLGIDLRQHVSQYIVHLAVHGRDHLGESGR